jgi:hypothetical protein
MTTLREFISNRRSAIRLQIDALKEELAELDAAERAISDCDRAHQEQRRSPRPAKATPSIKAMALEVLENCTVGADTNEIARLIAERFGVEVPRPSLSPQLSRLKSEGQLEIENKVWRRQRHNGDGGPDALESNEPPTSREEGGSEAGEAMDVSASTSLWPHS